MVHLASGWRAVTFDNGTRRDPPTRDRTPAIGGAIDRIELPCRSIGSYESRRSTSRQDVDIAIVQFRGDAHEPIISTVERHFLGKRKSGRARRIEPQDPPAVLRSPTTVALP
jgi:hypothetical protein